MHELRILHFSVFPKFGVNERESGRGRKERRECMQLAIGAKKEGFSIVCAKVKKLQAHNLAAREYIYF